MGSVGVVNIEPSATWRAPSRVWVLWACGSPFLRGHEMAQRRRKRKDLSTSSVWFIASVLYHYSVFLSVFICSSPCLFSSPTPTLRASKIFKHALKENCMVSATGMCYHFMVAVRSSLPRPQMENPSWAEEPLAGRQGRLGVSRMLFCPLSHFPEDKVIPQLWDKRDLRSKVVAILPWPDAVAMSF